MIENNAFHLINVSPFATQSEIADACENAAFDSVIPEDTLRKIESALIQPVPRLREEIYFLWGALDNEIVDLLSRIKNANNSDILTEIFEKFDLHSIAQANIVAEFCNHKDIEEFFTESSALEAILVIVEAQKQINEAAVSKLINDARKHSKVVPVIGEEHISEVLKTLRVDVYKKAGFKIICNMPHAGKFAEKLAEEYRFNKSAAGRFVHDLICNDYKNWVNSAKLKPLEKKIEHAKELLKDSPHNDDVFESMEKNLLEWDSYCQPIQLMEEGKGFDEQFSQNLFNKLRELALEMHNKHQETEKALHLTKILAQVFSELPNSSILLAKDIKQLGGIISHQENNGKINSHIKDFHNTIESISKVAYFPKNEITRMLAAFEELVANSSDVSEEERIWFVVRGVIIGAFNKHCDRGNTKTVLLSTIAFMERLRKLARSASPNSVNLIVKIESDILSLELTKNSLPSTMESVIKVIFEWWFVILIVVIGLIKAMN